METLFLVGLGVSVAFFFLRYAVTAIPKRVAWGGALVGILLMIVALTYHFFGPEKYAYLRADAGDLTKRASPIRLWICANHNLRDVRAWISPASANADPNNPAYWEHHGRGGDIKRDVLMEGCVLVGRGIPPESKSYHVQFNSSTPGAKEFIQILTIVELGGRLIETTTVSKGPKTVYEKAPAIPQK